MKTFFIKNPTGANLSARIKLDSGAEPINIGNPGATVIEGSVLTTCLAPTNPTMKPAVDFKTECFTLDDMGEYAVMVGDELIPHRFKPDQLPKFFHTSNSAVPITFGLCSDYDCSGALPDITTGGIWGDSKWEVNGVPVEDIYQYPGISVDQSYETRWVWVNRTAELLHVKCIGAIDLNIHDDGWDLLPTSNPTLSVNFDTGDMEFCLAPKPQISCVGATRHCEVPDDSDSVHYESIAAIIIDGVRYPRVTGTVENSFEDFNIPQNTLSVSQERRQATDSDGVGWIYYYYIKFINLTTENLRIELEGYTFNPNFENIQSEVYTNPTRMVDYQLNMTTFCLGVS